MTKKLSIFSSLALILAAVFGVQVVFGIDNVPTKQNELSAPKTLLNATTTSAYSTDISAGGGYAVIAGAKKVEFYFTRGGATGPNTGKSVFSVEVTPDGANWYSFNKLVGSDVSATATSTVSIVAATSTVTVGMNIDHDAFYAARCRVVETTDGEHTCKVQVEF